MSKQMGLIKLKGNIGGISFYKSGGEDLARMAGGPSKERIQNDAAFQRTRENNAEFGGSATAAKALRMALSTALQGKGDSRLAARLTRIFKEINSKSTGVRGQRSILLSENKTMLENFEFDNTVSFSGVFNAPFTVTPNDGRNQSVISFSDFQPNDFVKAPAGANFFRLVSALGVVSDYVYNMETGRYEPLDPALNMLNAVTYSEMISINGSATVAMRKAKDVAAVPLSLTTVLPGDPAPTITGDVSVIQCLGIEFYQRVDNTDYLLSQDSCMKIVKVF
jgi:hypothetical protein